MTYSKQPINIALKKNNLNDGEILPNIEESLSYIPQGLKLEN